MVHSAAVDTLIEDAKHALGINRLVLAVHDASFPSEAGEDTGRGSPYTRGGHAFVAFARELGFDGLQLGPQGQTSASNASPYDGSAFSKSVLSLPLRCLADGGRLDEAFVDEAVRAAPSDVADHVYAHRVHHEALARIAARVTAGQRADVAEFAARERWVEHDARFDARSRIHGHDGWPAWDDGVRAEDAAEASVDFEWRLGQLLLHHQHARFRAHCASLGMRLYGDLQVGLSLRDRWCRRDLFLPRFVMGAPPSRTNPEGQPWGYPVLDPHSAAAEAFFDARVRKMLAELDGLRLDHPHGIVCPWVYEPSLGGDDHAAVRAGGRLHESPHDPRFAASARVRWDQIDESVAPWSDSHVTHVEPAQVEAYGVLVGRVMARVKDPRDVLCEVLSTCPTPLDAVMHAHGLGRFRVTQKASLVNPRDGYRSENAKPEDWIMLGNHDTEPLARVVARWCAEGVASSRAAYLSTILAAPVTPATLFLGMTAELFASRARHVAVFFTDLFGDHALYNRPGVISHENWTLRVPHDYRAVYAARLARGEAFDLRASMAAALRVKRPDLSSLSAKLEEGRRTSLR